MIPTIDWTHIGPRSDPIAAATGDWRGALDAETLVQFLRAAASAGETVLTLVNDSHRATRTREALEFLSRLAADSGLFSRFRLLVATGTHRFTPDEREAFERDELSVDAFCAFPVAWHDAGDAAQLVEFAGARYHRLIPEHRFLLPVGSVEPHYFAGLTGAHKTVTIGVLSRNDIESNHRHALESRSDLLVLDGNPVYDGHAAWVHALRAADRRICAINQVVAHGRVLAAAAGEPLETLKQLAIVARDAFCHICPRPFDLARLHVPPPLGRMLYQADKALKNNHRAVRDGGAIMLEADCREGIGPDGFFEPLRSAATYADACAHVNARGYRLGDHKAVKLRDLTDPARRGVHVAIVSKYITDADAGAAGMRRFDSPEAALEWLCARTSITSGLHVDDAGNVCAIPAT